MALICPRCAKPRVNESEALLSLRLGTPFACRGCGQGLKQVHTGANARASVRENVIALLTAGAILLWVWLGPPVLAWLFGSVEGSLRSLERGLFYGGLAAIMAGSVAVSVVSMVREVRRDSMPERWAKRRWELRKLMRLAGFVALVLLLIQLRVFSLARGRVVLVVGVVLAVVAAHTVLVTMFTWSWLRRHDEAPAG